MPSRACTPGSRCSNHRNLENPLKPECREFVVIGEFFFLVMQQSFPENWILGSFETDFAGNGPSGIALSYLLSGNWPYYKGFSQVIHLSVCICSTAARTPSNKMSYVTFVFAAGTLFNAGRVPPHKAVTPLRSLPCGTRPRVPFRREFEPS